MATTTGCGTQTHVIGTNGGTMPCGALLSGQPYLCDACAGRPDYTERPVVVGEVWEGVLEFRTVRVVSQSDDGRAVWFLDEADALVSDDGKAWFEYVLPLAEFRERFTRRGAR